jgi:tRNA(adenine34) deaminase
MQVIGNVLAEEGGGRLKQFFAERRKVAANGGETGR